MNRSLAVKLRLYEIDRRSAELSATRSELAEMASQLNRLRQLNLESMPRQPRRRLEPKKQRLSLV
jgi:hypothetical protein